MPWISKILMAYCFWSAYMHVTYFYISNNFPITFPLFPTLTSLVYQLVLLDVLYIQQSGGQWFSSRMLDLR